MCDAVCPFGPVGVQPQLHLERRTTGELLDARPPANGAVVSIGQNLQVAGDFYGTSVDGIAWPLLSKGDQTMGGRAIPLVENINVSNSSMQALSSQF